jgi:hypothetical protein
MLTKGTARPTLARATPGRDVKSLPKNEELYVLARSHARILKERAIRRRKLKWLWAPLWLFPDIFPEMFVTDPPKMRDAQKKSLSAYRRRLKRQGMIRLEVQVRKDDAALLSGIANALTDPTREAETRALLRERLGAADAIGLKALLAAAPLEGIDLTRERDLDRDVIV